MSKAEERSRCSTISRTTTKLPFSATPTARPLPTKCERRVENPALINQGQSGTCGPASLVYDLLSRDPAVYVRAVQSLFDWGWAIIGKLHLKPGFYLLHAQCPTMWIRLTGSYWPAFAILRTGSTNIQRKRKLMILDPVRP